MNKTFRTREQLKCDSWNKLFDLAAIIKQQN